MQPPEPTLTDTKKTAPIVFSAIPLTFGAYCREIISYSWLIWVFAAKEIRMLYVQTYFGLLWSIIRPVMTLLIFTMIFRLFMHVPTRSPYYLFAFTGMIAWNFFSQISNTASTAILRGEDIFSKLYFPRVILLLAKIVVASLEFFISLAMLVILIAVSGAPVSGGLITLPLFLFYNVLCGFAIAIWMSVLSSRFHDLIQLMPVVIGIAIWVTPVFYPAELVPASFRPLLYLNPMAGVISGYRYALLGDPFPALPYFVTMAVVALLSLSGLYVFSRRERAV
ncbi:MAG: ABC transporter permease [Bacteroidetes bacterium]|nr:ABC transporter permease [Bacteroidota bacterium]